MKSLDINQKEIIKTVSILLLIGAVIALVVLINYYMSYQLMQLESQSRLNLQRATNIENFLNEQIRASQQQSQPDAGAETKK